MSKILKTILNSLIDLYGYETVVHHIEQLNTEQTESKPDGHDCPVGYYWSETQQRCVLDIG